MWIIILCKDNVIMGIIHIFVKIKIDKNGEKIYINFIAGFDAKCWI